MRRPFLPEPVNERFIEGERASMNKEYKVIESYLFGSRPTSAKKRQGGKIRNGIKIASESICDQTVTNGDKIFVGYLAAIKLYYPTC